MKCPIAGPFWDYTDTAIWCYTLAHPNCAITKIRSLICGCTSVGFFPCECDCDCANVVRCAIWVCLCVYTWLWLSTCNCGCLLAISVASECICVCVRICACLSHVLRRKKSHQKAHRDSFPCSSIQKLHSNAFLISTKFTWSKSGEFSLSRNGLVVRRRRFRF